MKTHWMQLLLSGLLVFAGTHALAGRTMISTSRPVGGISPAVVQMLGNRLQEIAIGEAELLSPRLLRPLELSGVESADPDDCDSERCDRILREHFQTLHTVHKASDLLLLQVVAEQETAQLRLKRVRVDEPMITTALATEVCVACEPPELLALLVPLFNQVWGAKLPEAPAVAEPEPLPPEPAPAPQEALAEDQPLPAQSVEEVTPEAPASDLAKELLEELEQGVTELPLDEEVFQEEYEVELRPAADTETLEKLFEPSPPDPYDVATAEYSQYLMTKLQDVSYTLQVYQTGMKVLVELEIGANGELLNQRLLESSGLEEFDQLALEQVEFMRFSPLPEPMVDYAPHVVHVYLQNSSL